jgi:hypothetical protein
MAPGANTPLFTAFGSAHKPDFGLGENAGPATADDVSRFCDVGKRDADVCWTCTLPLKRREYLRRISECGESMGSEWDFGFAMATHQDSINHEHTLIRSSWKWR